MSRPGLLAALLVALAVLAGCGSAGSAGDRIPGRVLTIYSSMPLSGGSRANAAGVLGGESLALAEIQSRIGRYRIVLRSLDDATTQRGQWDPGQTTENARLAGADKTTIGYIGEFNSGASAISIPLLNRQGITQVSPASTAVGLTSGGAGASPGEPQKYYPTGVRTYAQVVPDDEVQALAQVRLQKLAGCTSTDVIDDEQVAGQDAAESFTLVAQSAGLKIVARQTFDPGASDYSALAAAVAQTGARCVLISANTESGAALLTRQLAAASPTAKLFAGAGVADSAYADPAHGGIPLALDPRITITAPMLDPKDYPPAANAFYAAYRRRYGEPQPYAIYGYEAMSMVLSAIARATDNGTKAARRSRVLAAVFSTRNRQSVLGAYSIEPDGDTTLRRYGAYRIVGGRLSLWKVVDV